MKIPGRYTITRPGEGLPDFDDNGPLPAEDWSEHPRLSTLQHFPDLIEKYERVRLQARDLEEERNQLSGEIKTLLQLVELQPSQKVVVGRLSVCYTQASRKTFNKKKAVLLGLPADILEQCYDESTVQTLRIAEVGNSGE